MRIGAIFARGSCRALKWMALFSVVFALGVGSATAQFTPDPTYDTDGFKVEGLGKTIMEGEGATITVSMRATIDGGTAAQTTVTVTVAEVAPAAETPTDDTSDNAETADVILNNATVELVFKNNPTPDGGTTPEAIKDTQSAAVFVQTVHDIDAEREDFALSVTVAGGGTSITQDNIESTVVEDEKQAYVLKITTEEPSEGTTTIDGTVTADPAHVNMAANLRLHLDDPDYSLDNATLTGFAIGNATAITGAVASHTFMITPPTNDGNREEDTVTASLYSGTAGNENLEDEEPIKVADANALPAVTATVILLDEDGDPVDPQPEDGVESIMEGQTVDLKINVVDKDGKGMDADEKLMVMLTPTGDAGAQDYRLSMHPVEIASDDDSATVELTASEDQDVGMEMLMFDATVSGDGKIGGKAIGTETRMSMGIVSLAITDTTAKLVEAKLDEEIQAVVYAAKDEGEGEDELFNPGETIMVDASMLFTAAEGVGVVYTATTDMMDVAGVSTSGSMVTVTAGEPGGPAHITVTATAQPPAGAMALPQTSPNVARAIFPVDVVLRALSIDVMPESEMIDEGMSTKVMANASRAVEEDTSVALEVVGAVDMMPEAIMIEAGMDSGYVELTATADDDTEDAAITVVAIHSAIDGGSKTITITVNDTTEPPVETTYTLAAAADSVMEGGEVEINVTASQMADADTTIDLVLGAGSAGADDYTVETLMIEAGETTGGATLMAMDDSDVEGDETLTLNGMIGNVVVGSVTLTITDNDMAPPPADPTVRAKDDARMMIADAISTAAGDADWMVGGMAATVDMSMLFEVDEGVSAAYSGVSSDNDVVRAMSSGTMLTLTPMSAGSSTITVTASDSASMDVATVSHDAMVALQTLVLTVSASDDTVMEGGSVTLTATANRAVTEDAMLAVTVTGDTAAVDADEMLTITMGETSGTATVMAVEDDDSANAMVSVVVSGSGLGSPASFDISIEDNDPTVSAKTQAEVTAVFVTAVAMAGGADGWLPGGDAAMVDMSELFTTNGDPTVEYMAESSDADMVAASASGSTLTLTPMETGDATITVTATDTSGDEADTATVMSTVTVGVLPLEIMVSPTTAEVEEGGTVDITATANKMVDANVEVMLIRDAASSAGEDDFSLEPALITIMAGEATGMATLTATDDYDVEGNESLTLVARVKDHGDVGSVMVSITDNDMETTYELSGPMDMNIVEGMEYELTATANQAVHMDTEVMLMRDRAASDAGDDDYTVGSIMIMAGEMSGTTMLMVTEDNMPDAGDGTNMGESLVLVGSVDGMEVGTLEFIIWDAAVPALPIIAQLLLAAFLALGG